MECRLDLFSLFRFLLIFPLFGAFGCTLSASITSLTSEPAPESVVKGLQKIYFQSQSVSLSEGSFGVFNILSDVKATQDIAINLSLSGPSGRFNLFRAPLQSLKDLFQLRLFCSLLRTMFIKEMLILD